MQLVFDPRYRRLVDFLSLESEDLEYPHIPEKIMFLYDWAEKKTRGGDIDQVEMQLNDLRKSLGTTLRGKELLKDLYKFVKIDANKMVDKENKKLAGKTEEELRELEEKILAKEEKKRKDWKMTKEQIYKEKEERDLANKSRANTLARLIKSETKQQTTTNVNYKIAKDESPKAVRVKPYDKEIDA